MMQAQITVDRFLRSEQSFSLKLNIYECVLLVMLASYTGNKDNCFPSHQSLSRDCRISIDSVKRGIKLLEHKSLIKIVRSRGINNHYELTIPSAISTQCSQHLGANSTTHQVPIALPPSADSPTNNISNNISKCTSVVSPKKPQAKKPTKKHESFYPEDLKISDSHRTKARQLGLDVDYEFEHFREYQLAKGNKWADWGMAFHQWLRKAKEYSQPKKSFDNRNVNVMAGVCYE